MLPVEIHLPKVTSTNDHAKDLLRYYPYVMVTANEQIQGRGRRGRTWFSTPGNSVLCSFGIRHGNSLSTHDLSSWMGRAALTVLDVMAELTPQATVRLKYPNDVQVRDEQGWSKIAGILVENEFIGFVCQSTVVGIGLNVFEEQELDTISQRCTSLHRYGTIQDVETVRRSIRDRFSAWILAETPVVFERWETELVKHHSIVRIAGEDELWTVQHLLSDGKLSLTNANQTRQRVVSDGDSLQYLD